MRFRRRASNRFAGLSDADLIVLMFIAALVVLLGPRLLTVAP